VEVWEKASGAASDKTPARRESFFIISFLSMGRSGEDGIGHEAFRDHCEFPIGEHSEAEC
jgi:hypothetical protein